MSENPQSKSTLARWKQGLARFGEWVNSGWVHLVCQIANLRRRLWRKTLPDYAVITLDGSISERPARMPWWRRFVPGANEHSLSLASLADTLEQLVGEPTLHGVIFLIKSPSLSLAQAQSLAAIFDRFRQRDRELHGATAAPKRIIFHLEQFTRPLCLAACAADQIIVTPLTEWNILGFHSNPTFWRDTLAQLGVQMDVVKIAPWKTAFDAFSEPVMTPEYEAQTQWLYDSLYEELVNGIAKGRKLTVETVKQLIDGAPWNAEEARAAGLIDQIAYEDELPALLGSTEQPARLKPVDEFQHLLLRHPRVRPRQAIAVISLTGSIVPGRSRNFPVPLPIFGEETLGHLTAQQQIRAARKQDQLAAVVVHVDSRGGSALASDLIWHELALLNAEKPVVVYLGDVAASGGYYIALPSREIVAQRTTLTGSIGVITAKPVLRDAYAKLQAKRYSIGRGAHADLYSENQPWQGSQRAKIEASVQYNYAQFKERVAADRDLPFESLDEIANGRVWTGVQALAHGLVDALGDFQLAVERACALANLPTDGRVRVVDLSPPKQVHLASPVQAAQTWWRLNTTPLLTWLQLLSQNDWLSLLHHEHDWWLAADYPEIRF